MLARLYDALYPIAWLPFRRFVHGLPITLAYWWRRTEKEPVFILCAARTGSNLLVSYLNSVPGLSFAGEVLNPETFIGMRARPDSPQKPIAQLRRVLNHGEGRICGMKLFFDHLACNNLAAEDLQTHFPNARYIILYRRSLLAQFLSLDVAVKTRHFRWSKSFRVPAAICIDTLRFRHYCGEMKHRYEELVGRVWLRERCALVAYEDLADRPQSIFDDLLFPFLGIASRHVSTSMRKQITQSPEDLIANYEDIRPLIDAGTALQEYSFDARADVAV